MFEPIFEEKIIPVISIVAKGEFGVRVVNSLMYPAEIYCLKFEELEDLSKNDMTFIVADKLNEEEWAKIRRATSNPIVVVGCSMPEEVEFDSCSFNETSTELCSKIIKSIIDILTQEGLVDIDFADIHRILFECGKHAKAGYAENMLAKDATRKILNQLGDKSVSLDKAKGVLINIVAGEQLEFKEVDLITQTIIKKTNQEATIIFGTRFDANKSGKELDLSVVVTY